MKVRQKFVDLKNNPPCGKLRIPEYAELPFKFILNFEHWNFNHFMLFIYISK